MALTVGELLAVLDVDDSAMRSGLAAAESDATRAGQAIGENVVRGADGRLRDMRGRFVAAGRNAGDGLAETLADSASEGADAAGDQAATTFGDSLKAGLAGVGLAAGAILVAGFGQALDQGAIVGKMGAQLSATPAEAKRYGEIAGDLFADAITSDFQTAADAVKAVMKSGIAPPEATNAQIESMATKTADLAAAWDEDLGGVTRAVTKLMSTGLATSAEEAFDLIAQGYKTSANSGGDFLDTINEYSVQFARVGLDGQTAFGLIDQAIKAGARDSDQVADALGQFGELATAGGTAVDEAFKSIGLNADDVRDKLSKGGKAGQQALQMTLDALRGTKDEQVKLNAATALFGDPGTVMADALFAMDPASAAAASGMNKAGGAAKSLGDGMRDNAAHSVAQFKQSLQQGLVEFLGTSVIPKLMEFVKFLVDHKAELYAFAAVITAVVVPALVLLGAKALWAGMQMAKAWVVGLGPIGWIGLIIGGLVVLIIAYWDDVKKYTLMAWDYVVGKLTSAKDGILEAVSFLGAIPGMISEFFGDAKDYAVQKMLQLVSWSTSLPGKIAGAISALGGLLWSWAGRSWQRFRDASAQKVVSLISWVRGLPGRISGAIGALNNLLYSKGTDVVRGLWNGIKSMGSWLKSTLIGWVKDIIPGPVAKALGIASPSKVMRDQIGRWIPAGIVEGIKGGQGAVARTMATLVPSPSLPSLSPAGAMPGAAVGGSPFATASTGAGALVQIENWHAAEHGSPDDNARALEWLAKARG